MNALGYDLTKLNPREKRLAKEHLAIDELCRNNTFIEYKVVEREELLRGSPPKVYQILYHLTSIVNIDDNRNPIIGNKHTVEIRLPKHYPVEAVSCYAVTDIWHPNIKWDGKYKGRICGNIKDFGKTYSLDMLILRIAQILQFKNYLAENVPPYPEEEKAAKWVREYAEPLGILDKFNGFNEANIPSGSVDPSLLSQAQEAQKPAEVIAPKPAPPKKSGISIRKKEGKRHDPNKQDKPSTHPNLFSGIKIKRK